MRDAWSTLPGNLVTARYIDDIYDEVSKFARVVCSEVVAAGLQEQHVRRDTVMKVLEREQVGRDVFPDSRVRAAAGLNRKDARGREGLVLDEELLVFAREDVVRYCRCRACGDGMIRTNVRCEWGSCVPMLYSLRNF